MSNPLTIDAANLLFWCTADEMVPGGYQLKSSGPGTPPAVNLQGSKAGLGGTTIIVDSVAAGTGTGQATFKYFIDGGTTPIATGVTTQSAGVALTGACSGETYFFPAGTYAVGQRWDQWCAVIVDQSSQGGDYDSQLVGFSPSIESAGWNGLPSVLWDGTASLLYADGRDLANRVCGGSNKGFHLYLSLQMASLTAGQCLLNFGRTDGNSAGFEITIGAGPLWTFKKTDATGAAVTCTGGVPDLNRCLLDVHHTGTVLSANVTTLAGGTTALSLSGGGAQSVGTLGTLNTSGWGLRKTGGASSFSNKRARELAIFAGAHSAVSSMRSYMLGNSPL
jgi:hypothetical protein